MITILYCCCPPPPTAGDLLARKVEIEGRQNGGHDDVESDSGLETGHSEGLENRNPTIMTFSALELHFLAPDFP